MSAPSALNPVTHIAGVAVPLPQPNLDTDQIMPKQFLRGIDKAGLAEGVFYDMRFDAQGQLRPDATLNQAAYGGATVVVAGPNFGCGSSREHAVWGLQQYGIAAVLAPSFGEIFYSNAIHNRLLPAQLAPADAEALLALLQAQPGLPVAIDIAQGTVRAGDAEFAFTLAPRYRTQFLSGTDMIGATLAQAATIAAFEAASRAARPWQHDVARKIREHLDTGRHPAARAAAPTSEGGSRV